MRSYANIVSLGVSPLSLYTHTHTEVTPIKKHTVGFKTLFMYVFVKFYINAMRFSTPSTNFKIDINYTAFSHPEMNFQN